MIVDLVLVGIAVGYVGLAWIGLGIADRRRR